MSGKLTFGGSGNSASSAGVIGSGIPSSSASITTPVSSSIPSTASCRAQVSIDRDSSGGHAAPSGSCVGMTAPGSGLSSCVTSGGDRKVARTSALGASSAALVVGGGSSASVSSAAAAAASSSSSVPGSTNDLASLFECPVCYDYVLPPILQCQSGHLVCSTCRSKLSCCPTCRGSLGNIRNLAMEKVASTVMFPCRYVSSGCSSLLLHTHKAEHEETCECRPYQCPCPGSSCKWQGGLDQVMTHLTMAHKSITTLQGEDIVFLATDINLPGAVDWVMMQSCYHHHFMLVLEKQEKYDGHQQFFAIVQLIGSRKQADNFAYRLELNGHRRRLTWEATPRSIHEGVSSAIMKSDCLVFDTSIAQLFADNGNLGINVTISMC